MDFFHTYQTSTLFHWVGMASLFFVAIKKKNEKDIHPILLLTFSYLIFLHSTSPSGFQSEPSQTFSSGPSSLYPANIMDPRYLQLAQYLGVSKWSKSFRNSKFPFLVLTWLRLTWVAGEGNYSFVFVWNINIGHGELCFSILQFLRLTTGWSWISSLESKQEEDEIVIYVYSPSSGL